MTFEATFTNILKKVYHVIYVFNIFKNFSSNVFTSMLLASWSPDPLSCPIYEILNPPLPTKRLNILSHGKMVIDRMTVD